MARLIALTCRAGDLSTQLAESVKVVEHHGPEWLREVRRARAAVGDERAVLLRPEEAERMAAWGEMIREETR